MITDITFLKIKISPKTEMVGRWNFLLNWSFFRGHSFIFKVLLLIVSHYRSISEWSHSCFMCTFTTMILTLLDFCTWNVLILLSFSVFVEFRKKSIHLGSFKPLSGPVGKKRCKLSVLLDHSTSQVFFLFFLGHGSGSWTLGHQCRKIIIYHHQDMLRSLVGAIENAPPLKSNIDTQNSHAWKGIHFLKHHFYPFLVSMF